jgi:ATP-binding cassette subfamily F protein 3
VIVSHDAHLISAVCDFIWVVADKKVTPFDGDFEEYRTKMLKSKTIKQYQ